MSKVHMLSGSFTLCGLFPKVVHKVRATSDLKQVTCRRCLACAEDQ